MIAMIKCFNKSFKKEDESNDGDQGKDKKQIKRLGNPTLIMVGLNENTSFSPPL